MKESNINTNETVKSFWQRTLKGFTASTPLVVDCAFSPDPVKKDGHGKKEIRLSDKLTSALQLLMQQQQLTLEDLLLGVWGLLLNRYSSEEDIVFGVNKSCRQSDMEEEQLTAGYFNNTLPFRVQVHPKMLLLPWLKELKIQRDAFRKFENVSLKEINKWCGFPQDHLLFESIVVFGNVNKQTNYPLALAVHPEPRLLQEIVYEHSRFDNATINRMSGHFITLLEGIVANPNQYLLDLPLLTAAEQHQILVEWNSTQRDYPNDQCIHQIFETTSERYPDSVAVIFEGIQLTYKELNERANQLASYLIEKGVGPDVLIGICMERSLEMVVGILGILKSGGAYVPLDPKYPKDLLVFMLEDSNASIVLTQKRLLQNLSKFKSRAICVDSEWTTIEQEIKVNPENGVQPNSLCYVIYTSGSTGKPKGTMIMHKSLVNYLSWCTKNYDVAGGSGAPVHSSIAFDATITSLFSPLLVGKRVLLLPEKNEIESLCKALSSNNHFSLVKITPAYLNILNQLLSEQEAAIQTKAFIIGGEALLGKQISFWRINAPNIKIINEYGPTEAVVGCCVYEVSNQTNLLNAIPIGRPIANTEIFLLDQNQRPVPIGIPGELHIGGEGLARGYLNRPELSAQKFISNPFSKDSMSRLYKTGDLARYLPDGNIEFLGRIDNQVKIRGFRIELGGIETLLVQHPHIRDVIVLAREDDPDNKRLVAYVVPEEGFKPLTDELRHFLKKKLPEHMIPSVFMMLDSIPLTPNGKVDREALPAPDQKRPELEKEFVAPRTSVEKELAKIWCEVLKLKQIGIYDNFFELGGHSLRAAQVMVRAMVAFNVEFPLQTFFLSPTIADLSEKILEAQNLKTNKEETPIVKDLKPILRRKNITPAILSFAQKRLWFLDQYNPGSCLYNIPMAFRLLGYLNVDALHKAINTIVSRHESLRTTFTVKEGEPVQVVTPNLNLNLPLIDICDFTDDDCESEIQRLINEEAQKPFDLSCGPLLRTTLLKLKDDEHVFLLTIHHIISDGWSITVINQELGTLYDAFCSNEQSRLSELPIQYADFAEWQDGWMKEEELENQLNYWKDQLNGAPSMLQLPNDHPRPMVQSFMGTLQSMILPVGLSEDLKKLSCQEEVTLFMIMLSAFQILLYRYTGQTNIVVGSPIANRTHSETEKLIGFFVNTLVFRVDFSNNSKFSEFLKQVRQVTINAFENQDLPFEKLVEELQPERNLSYSPLFQVMFAFENVPSGSLEMSNLTLTPVKVDSKSSKFDLTLFVKETDQGLRAEMEYNTDLFNRDTIRRMLGHYQTLLESITKNPDSSISTLQILTKVEQDQLLLDWNNTKADYPHNKCIHQLFETQVEKTPNAVAVICEDMQLTYKELNDRANQLAYYLRECGVGPDILVGICMERSIEMVISLLAILKADGAYVPIDPAYPKERLEFMLVNTKTPVLITDKSVVDILPVEGVRVICMGEVKEKSSSYGVENLPNLSNSEDLVYVIYTSGSTGIPKGVEVPHRGVVRLLFGVDYVPMNAEQTILQLATISFDAATFEIWGALLHGAKLVLFPERFPTPGSLGSAIKKYGVNVLWLTSSLFNTVIDEAPEELSTLRQLLIGGEALSVTHVRRALELLPSTRIINGYGPTENTTFTCCYPIPRDLNKKLMSIPIGRPIGNTEVYILDKHLNPVPIGVFGELHLSGAGLARGYLNNPELTAERFIPNPFSQDSRVASLQNRRYRSLFTGR